MTTYASHRREMDRKNRRIKTGAWACWKMHAAPTGTTGKVKIDPDNGTLWEWVSANRQNTWARPFHEGKECETCLGAGRIEDADKDDRGRTVMRKCLDCSGTGKGA